MSSLQIPTADYVRLVKTFPNQQRLQAGHSYWQSYGPGWRGFFFARGIASKIIFTKSKISRFQRLITSWQDVSWFKARWRLDSTKEELSFDVIFWVQWQHKNNMVTVQRENENQTPKVRALLADSAVLESSFDVEWDRALSRRTTT